MVDNTNDGDIANAKTLVDELTYISYAYNRRVSPHISVDRWRLIYTDVDTLEKRYQREKGDQR